MNKTKINIDIPKEWKWQRLEDALDFVIGGDWGKDESFEDANYGAAYCIRGAEIKNWDEEKGRTASLRKIKLANIEKRKLIEGDILVEISGGGPEQPVGRTVLIDKSVLSYKPDVPKICTNFLRLIRPNEFVDSRFLNLYLKLFYYSGEIVNYQAGSNNLRNLKFPDYININFPLPPKPTQQAIVSKIEELFSELDKGIEQLKTTQQQLKTYRQAVLKWAFEGKLTEAWRSRVRVPSGLQKEGPRVRIPAGTHKVPRAGIESALLAESEVNYKKNNDLPEGWTIKALGQISEMCLGKMLDKHKNKGTYKPYLRNISVRWGSFDLNNLEQMRFEENELERYSLRKGDLVVCEGGEPGRCAIWNLDNNSMMIQKALHRVRVAKEVNVKYIYYLIRFKNLNGSLQKHFTGTTIKHLTGKELNKIQVPLASLKEQNQIVREIESRISVADKMEESINQCLEQAEALRQSILKKAFEGRLVD